MKPQWPKLNDRDRAAALAALAFLDDRLEDRRTIDWALQLSRNDAVKRMSILDAINSPAAQKIGEPWRTAWRLIEESWRAPPLDHRDSSYVFDLQHRLRGGDRSGALIASIVDHVLPRIEVSPFSEMALAFDKKPKIPRTVTDLFSVRLQGGSVIDPETAGINKVTQRDFLLSLAHALEGAVVAGLDIAKRIGWSSEWQLWRLGQLNRVYYVPLASRPPGEHEPDEFHHGIAPSTKLLFAVVARLADLDALASKEFSQRWRLTNSTIHLRLWAAISRNRAVTSASEVFSALQEMSARTFWNVNYYPEIAELRALRFAEFSTAEQAKITSRIRKRPPQTEWPKKADRARVNEGRTYWAARELKRIQVAGAALPKRDQLWLEAQIQEFPQLLQDSRLDTDFPGMPEARWVPPNPDSRYDALSGQARLNALETALSSPDRGWDDSPSTGANDWIRQSDHTISLLGDFESSSDKGASTPQVWNQFGWSHSPQNQPSGAPEIVRNLSEESNRVLSLLLTLPPPTLRKAIEGLSHWMSAWDHQIVEAPTLLDVWLKIWTFAVEATNVETSKEEEVDLNTVASSTDDREPVDLDTLNTPAGRLVGVFLTACPNLNDVSRPFDSSDSLRKMRDVMIAAEGRSALIVRHRLIEGLHYFLNADPDWSQSHLIAPLRAEHEGALALWRAIARRTQFYPVLSIIGDDMAGRVTDTRLGRQTRSHLAFSLVVEGLHAFLKGRVPAVQYERIQQMIRSVEDEVRAHAAGAIQRFTSEISAASPKDPSPPTAEEAFRAAAAPFLQQVWPQERSLVTPGVSRALADLPATAPGAFAEAVQTIERFLVPFDCWSMLEYGLYGDEDDAKKISQIVTRDNAEAFLHLLDLTIGTAEGSVVPLDLADALDHIRTVAPRLGDTQPFRRLATAARRI